MKKVKLGKRIECIYHQMGNYFNHGGARPCMSCDACREDFERYERLKKWNRDTANGADPRR